MFIVLNAAYSFMRRTQLEDAYAVTFLVDIIFRCVNV